MPWKLSKIIAVFIGIVALAALGVFYFGREEVDRLEPPILKNFGDKSGANLLLSGTAYPKSKVLVYVNGQYEEDILTDNTGHFEKNIIFKSEGIKKISTKQVYKNIASDFSDEAQIEVDITAPDMSKLRVNELPSFSKQGSILVRGSGESNSFIVLNRNKYKIDASGKFEVNHPLTEGSNVLEIKLADDLDNMSETAYKHTIVVDSIPPKLETLCLSSAYKSLRPTEELVCISIGSWEGYLDSVNSVPITGSVSGQLKNITIDGKAIRWDENNEIYQRINLFIHGGLNKYKVVAEDNYGNVSTGYVQTDAERTKESIDLNINE